MSQYKTLDDSLLTEIITEGQFYNPASKHYGRTTDVQCDKCLRNKLDMCIGYKEYDLCLKCVIDVKNIKPAGITDPVITITQTNQDISSKFSMPPVTPASEPKTANPHRKIYVTGMLQHQYDDTDVADDTDDTNSNKYATFMLQNQFG